MNVQRIAVQKPIAALRWDGDDLVDFSDGPDRWRLDGTADLPRIRRTFAFPFDQAIVSPSGQFQAVYAERGTKALLLRDGKIVRELNRSYYHAKDYDYPITLGVLPDGREVVVHCPDAYNVLQVEDAETGRRLTDGPRTPSDVFHSRLSVSPDGRHMLMAGWFWHPYGTGMIFDLQQAIRDPTSLDGQGILALYEAIDAEVAAACWLDADRAVIATTSEDALDGNEPDALGPGQVGVWSVSSARWLHRTTIEYPVGTLVACGGRVMSLYGHPKLLDPATGAVIAEWADVETRTKQASYGVTHIPTPIAALHRDGTRLAIVGPDAIAVLALPTA